MMALYPALLNGVDGKRTHIIDEMFSQNPGKSQNQKHSKEKRTLNLYDKKC
jgi:hypothetical protein